MTKKEQQRLRKKKRCELAQKILCELNNRKTRATYGAVGCILGVLPQDVGKYLGCRRPKASWVVRKSGPGKGKPTGYKKCEIHPQLYCNRHVITSCRELRESLGLPPASKHGPGCDG